MPVYEVIEAKSGTVRLVDAALPSQARSYVAKDAYTVKVADAKRVGELFQARAVEKVEDVNAEDVKAATE
jgi:hypothetical protein